MIRFAQSLRAGASLLLVVTASPIKLGHAACTTSPATGANIENDPYHWHVGGYFTSTNGFNPICQYEWKRIPDRETSAENMRAFMTSTQLQDCIKKKTSDEGPSASYKSALAEGTTAYVVKNIQTEAEAKQFRANLGIPDPETAKPVWYAVVDTIVKLAPAAATQIAARVIPGGQKGLQFFKLVDSIVEGACHTDADFKAKQASLKDLMDPGGRIVFAEEIVKMPAGKVGEWDPYFVIRRSVSYQVDVGNAKTQVWKTKVVPLYSGQLAIKIQLK